MFADFEDEDEGRGRGGVAVIGSRIKLATALQQTKPKLP
jgi:hypothetical protein